jgi:type IV pilus modification protein PilV
MDRTRSNNSGFTLVEALAAMFILTIGILTLITMQTMSVKGNAKARNLTVASTWGQDRIEKIFVAEFDDVVDGSDTSPDGHYTISWTVDDNILTSVPDLPLKQVTVTIDRKDFGADRRVSFNYYRQKIY